jgi:glycosyltransferase involved in cell wall biosynthesis
MKISYAVTTHNEHKEIAKLIPFILENKDPEDELVIIDDHSDYKTLNVFDEYIHDQWHHIKFVEHALYSDFSVHKNFMNKQCSGDWIVNIDADEIPNQFLMQNIKALISTNPEVELYWVPRVNTVEGLTDDHIKMWNWRVEENGWVNWPDPQQRIYKNADHIEWVRPVHERLVGAKKDAFLPYEEQWCLYHPKTIQKQESQNQKYAEILR